MTGFFINGDEVKIIRTGETLVRLETFDGKVYENLEVLRLFPVSGMMKYISLIDESGKEIAIIRDVESLLPESAQAVRECLDAYYVVPKILKLLGLLSRIQ
jgi:hypothetical protein